MRRKVLTAIGAAAGMGMIIAALWTWRHAARLSASANDSQVNLAAARCLAIALAAGAQLLLVRVVAGAAFKQDPLLRGAGAAAAVVCAVGIVSAVALGLAGH